MLIDHIDFRRERPEDFDAIDELHRQAFGEEDVTRLVRALRAAEANLAPISIVAEADDRVVGHVMLTAAYLDAPARLVDVMVLSPLATADSYRRRGIGAKLIARSLEAADRLRVPLVFLEGHPAYYGRHGFDQAEPLGFRRPSLRIPNEAFQVARLSSYEDWMTGSFVYSEPFWKLDCVGLR